MGDNTRIFYNFVAFYEQNAFRTKKVLNEAGYVLVYGIWYLLSLLSMRLLHILSNLLYLIMAYILRYRHRVIWKNLSSSFPEKSHEKLVKIEKDFYHWFRDYLMETIRLMTTSASGMQRRMKFTGLEQFNKTLSSGQSCAIYLGYHGNWEWATSLPNWLSRQVQCCQLYHPLKNRRFNRLFKRVRECHKALCIPTYNLLHKILEFKRSNQAIAVGHIADQVPLRWDIHHWLDFLYHDMPVLTGAERIIKHTGQACFYGDTKRVKRGYYEYEMKFIALNPKQCKKWELTDMYFRMLEETIRQQPACYLWSHNRWKRTHEEFERDREVVDREVSRKKND